MKPLISSKSIVRLALAWALIALLPMCQAQTAVNLSKHARKVHKTLLKYPSGTYLHLELQDGADIYGKLGALEDASFKFVESDSNATETVPYENVSRVKRDAPTVNTGDYPRHHRKLIPILLVAAAAGAGAAVYFTYIK